MKKIYTILIIVLISTLINFINIKAVYSNWKPIEKSNNNFIEADLSQSSKTNSSISEEQVRGYLDENGVPIFSQNKKNDNLKNAEDSLQSDAFSESILNGLTAGDFLGSSVSGAGDVMMM